MEPEQSRQLEHILGRMSVGVAILACTDLRFRYVNPYLLSLLEESWGSQRVIGHRLDEIAPREVRKVALPILQQVCSTGQSARFSDVPYEGLLKTRGRTYWRVGIEPAPDFVSHSADSEEQPHNETQNACDALLVTVEDETSLVRSRLHLKAFHNVSSAIAGPFALPQVLDRILQAVQEMVGSTRCAVMLIDALELGVPGFEEQSQAAKQNLPGAPSTMSVAAQRGIHAHSQDWHPQVSERLLVGRVMRDRRTLLITDTSTEPELEFPLLDDEGVARRPGSVLCVPIFEPGSDDNRGDNFNGSLPSTGAVLGTIEVYHRRARGFAAEEVELLEQFAQQAGLAIQHARLLRDISRLVTEQAAARERIEAEVVARTAELAQQNEKLKTLERAREDFFTTMAHELKTPLANIRAHLSALLARDLEWSAREQYEYLLEAADEQVERIVGMINHFLDASRVEAGALRLEREPILLPEMFEDLQDRLEALISSSQRRLEIHASADLPAVLADYELIMSVLTNLLSNAFHYALEGDTVLLEAESMQQLSGVELRVIDYGPGMTQEQQAELFTRFSTFAAQRRPAADRPGQAATARRRGSTRWSPTTGLGLYISRGIIEAHGSILRVKSNPGEGATFAFMLPVASTIARER